ncbi:MAG: CRISPR-associated endonuclease Cas2 [gamma proteobacterium symbiont of Ctena orbiculata]|nr:MAG: CRISPR-associated endonuclease Cas2 [gamma proteobacterium symbiont of Ctena orbiculata]
MNRTLERLWIIAYDIEDDATRRRVRDILENHGQRVQYSIFECWLHNTALQRLRAMVQMEIEVGDQVRWYPSCQACQRDIQWQGGGDRAENEEYFLL